MLPSQLIHREKLLNRSYKALDVWSDRQAQEFRIEMKAVAEGLQSLAEEVDAGKGNQLERSRNWRYVGYTYFELADAKDLRFLKLSAEAFKKSVALLNGINNPIEEMKLNYLFGQALLNLSEGKDFTQLKEARHRFTLSLAAAQTAQPSSVRDVEEAITTVDRLIALSSEAENMGHQIADLQESNTSYEEQRNESDITSPEIQEMLGILKDEYNKDISAGKVSGTRQKVLNPLLSELEALVNNNASTLEESQNRRSQVGDLQARMFHLLSDTSHGTPSLQENSRADKVWKLFSKLKVFLAFESTRPQLGNDEQLWGKDIFVSCAGADTALHEDNLNDEKVLNYETDYLRKLASEVRRYSLRNHLTLISPIWESTVWPENPNALFFSGGDDLKKVVGKVCSSNKLQLLSSTFPRDYGSERWDQLRSSNVAIFDFSGYRSSIFDLDPDNKTTASIFGVAYELGIALTLGRPIVVFANNGQSLPFDVDIEPVRLNNDDEDLSLVEDAIYQALYGLQRGSGKSTLNATRAYLKDKFQYANSFIEQSLKQIDKTLTMDAVRFRRSIESLLGSAGPGAPQIVFPSWPGSYPVATVRSCFHVMPFGPPWAAEVMETVEMKCIMNSKPTKYIRGDEVLDPNIICSIWDKLCQATHIVVDLTGFNPNVGLELGIAHTLGRNVLLVCQDNENQYPQAIRKRRIHRYLGIRKQELNSLSQLIESFLGSS